MAESADVQGLVRAFQADYARIEREVHRVIVGHERVVDEVLMCLLSGGHALLEGVPGLGKTMLVRTLSDALDLQFGRIQFTPDLMPTDITGTNVLVSNEGGGKAFQFQPGPIFGNLILADEINRATPKTQSAVLEAMQEHSVSVARTTHHLPEPFFVLATQNPLEMEGTYPLPEAQLDRFMFKIVVEGPRLDDLMVILERTTGDRPAEVEKVVDGLRVLEMQHLARQVPVGAEVRNYAARLVLATHPESEYAPAMVKKFVKYGASPRAGQAMVLAGKVRAIKDGRAGVSFADVRGAALPALRHRLILNFEGQAEGISADEVVGGVLEAVPEVETA